MAKDARKVVKKPADPSFLDLPFARVETDRGPLYRRVLRYGLSHRVGRFAVADAKRAEMGMVALLARDPSLAGVDPRGLLYVDTETTGLAGGTGTVPFLVGMARFEDEELVLEQLLLRQLGEEEPILTRLSEEVHRASALVSYNGKSFDLPLLRTRLVLSRIEPLPPVPHLDLVHLARRVHGTRVKPCTLVAIENEVLGYERHGDIPGGEVVSRYRHFLRTGDESALVEVIDHNAWDIVALSALVGLYGGPLSALPDLDLVGAARSLRTAGSPEEADRLADLAVSRGVGADALRERALAKQAQGERDQAVTDFEAVLADTDDPSVRLALAKLYEHHVKHFDRALELVVQGTGEAEPAREKRRARLDGKRARKKK